MFQTLINIIIIKLKELYKYLKVYINDYLKFIIYINKLEVKIIKKIILLKALKR